jgi:hypothetical protein
VHGANFFGSAIEVKQHCRDIGHADVTQQSSATADGGGKLTGKIATSHPCRQAGMMSPPFVNSFITINRAKIAE